MEPIGVKARYVAEFGVMRVVGWHPGSNADIAITKWNELHPPGSPLRFTKDSVILGIDDQFGRCGDPGTHSPLAVAFRVASTEQPEPRFRVLAFTSEAILPEESGEAPLSVEMQIDI